MFMERPSLEPSVDEALLGVVEAGARRFSEDKPAWPEERNGTCERSMVPFDCTCGCGAEEACACALTSRQPRLQFLCMREPERMGNTSNDKTARDRTGEVPDV
jgi:hypothetical protein